MRIMGASATERHEQTAYKLYLRWCVHEIDCIPVSASTFFHNVWIHIIDIWNDSDSGLDLVTRRYYGDNW